MGRGALQLLSRVTQVILRYSSGAWFLVLGGGIQLGLGLGFCNAFSLASSCDFVPNH